MHEYEDNNYMEQALDYAKENAVGEKQVGAILVKQGKVIAKGASNSETGITAIEDMYQKAGGDFKGGAIFTTFEPYYDGSDPYPTYKGDDVGKITANKPHLITIGVLETPGMEQEMNELYGMQYGIEYEPERNKKIVAECMKLYTSTGGEAVE